LLLMEFMLDPRRRQWSVSGGQCGAKSVIMGLDDKGRRMSDHREEEK